MRRRWRWQWGADAAFAAMVIWFAVGWAPGAILVNVSGRISDSTNNVLILLPWFGPFGVVALLYGVWRLPGLVRWLRANPPVRRELENVPDMREVHKR